MRIVFIGDIVGRCGRSAVAGMMPALRAEFRPDLVIANAENAAGGIGISREAALEVLQSGVDVITLGNHTWAKKDIYPYLDEEERILRPANYPAETPGHGYGVFNCGAAGQLGVISLCGRVFMEPLDNPFRTADSIVETLEGRADVILVDFHGEATSEKNAFGRYMDGRVGAVLGTHTHVQTADEKILSGGTAYITDVGMTGPIDSVIGIRPDLIIARFLTQMPNKFVVGEGPAILSAVVVDLEPATGMATAIKRVQRTTAGT